LQSGQDSAYNGSMGKIKVVSFDVEGTLVTPAFSDAVWHGAIPSRYAKARGISLEKARAIVEREYEEVGDKRLEWYDVKYWFRRFGLGDYQEVLRECRHSISCYEEIVEVLSSLRKEYTLVVASSSSRDCLPLLLDGIGDNFVRVFSSVSDYEQLKSPEFYLTVCREMGVAACEMAHVGDSWHFDFQAARESGVEAFHLDRYQERRAERSLQSLRELKPRLEHL